MFIFGFVEKFENVKGGMVSFGLSSVNKIISHSLSDQIVT